MDPSVPVALADAGGWAVVVAMITGLGIGFVRGWLVPGFVYRREVERGDKADIVSERTADAMEKLVADWRAERDERKRGGG